MNEQLYDEMDPDYRARIFMSRKALLGSLESPTLLPENGLSARDLLDDSQLKKISQIRHRRHSPVMARFSET